GKNHLGDRNEFLPTVHGFDEFYGILYHLNAMEEPYEHDYPKAPNFRANFGPRNIVDTKATAVDDPTIDPRWGKVGKQVIVDGGNSPFRGEKGTTYEGGFRVPMVMKWPGTVKPGRVINDITAGEDLLPTFLAAAGESDVKGKLLNGMKVGEKTFKTHLDGYN